MPEDSRQFQAKPLAPRPSGSGWIKLWGGSIILRAVFFVLLWAILSGGLWRETGIIVVIIFAGTLVSLVLCPPGCWQISLRKLPVFLFTFLKDSFLGGVDVAFRAFSPSMPLESIMVEFSHDMGEKEQLLFGWVVSLLPGTVCLSLGTKTLQIHSLDKSIEERLRILEKEIRELLGGKGVEK